MRCCARLCKNLVFALFSGLATLVASLSVRRPLPMLIVPVFLLGLLTSELTWFFLGLQMLIAILFVAAGALGESVGVGVYPIDGNSPQMPHYLLYKADCV